MLDATAFADYTALRTRSAYCDWQHSARIEIVGDDRLKFLHSYCTNEIKSLQPGQGCEAFVPNVQGKVLGFLRVFCENDRLILETAQQQAATLLSHFDRFILRSKVEFQDKSLLSSRLLVAGPEARELLSNHAAEHLPTAVNGHSNIRWCGIPVWIARIQFFQPESWLLAVNPADQGALESALAAQGVRRVGAAAQESLRLESGEPLYGPDMSIENLPQELRIDSRAVSFNKGCYLGQETIARIDAMGHVNWLWAGFRFDPDTVPFSGCPLTRNDKTVGRVTSVAWSPILAAPLAVGFVRRGHDAAGTVCQSPAGSATVVTIPVDAHASGPTRPTAQQA